MNGRIKELRKVLDLTQQEFADKIGSKRNTIAKYETDANTPSAAVVSLICRQFNVNENWLLTSKGDMFIKMDRADISIDNNTNYKDRIIGAITVMSDLELKAIWSFISDNYRKEVE